MAAKDPSASDGLDGGTAPTAPPIAGATQRFVAIGEIAAEVAHELRNALQIVSANVYLARQNLAGSEPQLAKIERAARLAHGIVDDLMALARGEPAHAEPVSILEILMPAREMLPELGADFHDDIPSTLRVRAHVGLAARLLHALYENAIHATNPRRPRIVTRASKSADEKRVTIEVEDDGPGVPMNIAMNLFDPLVTAREGGTGLGLALARRIAQAHGGSIVLLEKNTDDETKPGATFRIDLPAA